MSAHLITLLLFFLPLVVIPIGISPFETPKVVLAEVIIEILLFFKIFTSSKRFFKELINPQLIFVGILFILSLDTQLIFNPHGAFFGNAFRLQGQFLFWHLLLFSILTSHISKFPKIAPLFSFVGLFLGTLILGVRDGRAFGTLGEPNALAATALFIFAFVFWSQSKSMMRIMAFVIALTIILLSGSRAGLVGFSIEIIFIFLTQFVKLAIFKSSAVCFYLILLSLTLPFFQSSGWFENRSQIWQIAFNAGFTSPIIGHGFGNIQKIIHDSAILQNSPVQYLIVDSAHNFLLDFWLQGGLVGIISILILIFLSLQHFIRHKRLLELTAFLGLMTAMLFNPVSVVNLLAFWWLIGQGFDIG